MVTEISGATVDPSTDGNSLALSHALPSLENGWPPRPFQIVSLLEVYSFNAELFLIIAKEVEIWRSNAHVRSALERKTLEKNYLQDVEVKLKLFSEACGKVGLDSVPPHAERILEKMERKGEKYDSNDLYVDSNELHFRIQDDIAKILVMRIPKDRQEFYEKPTKGWEQIVDRFPKAQTDIEEAYKCLALARYSAAVFHSLQIIEFGLIDLGSFISVNDPISGWTSIAQHLKKIIDTNYHDLSAFEKANRPFLEQLQGTVCSAPLK